MSSVQGARQPTAGLSTDELQKMFQNAVKLTNDNKINNNNCWDLSFTTHMPDIIRLNPQQGPNFQRAGSALEAGTRIYSKRVDSTYNATFQMLQGFSGAAYVPQPDGDDDDVAAQGDQDGGGDGGAAKRQDAVRKARNRVVDVDPAGTLATADSLRVKKTDTTLESDPLFCRTTKLFDESSASGLLLLNYPVHNRTHVLFEGSEQPLAQLPLTTDPALNKPDKQLDARLLSDLAACLDKCATRPMTPSITLMHQELTNVQASRAVPPPALDNTAMLRAALGSKYVQPGTPLPAPTASQRTYTASQAAVRSPVVLAGQASAAISPEDGPGAASQQQEEEQEAPEWQGTEQAQQEDTYGGGGGGGDEGTWGLRDEGSQGGWGSDDVSGGGVMDDSHVYGGQAGDDEDLDEDAMTSAGAVYDEDDLLGLTALTAGTSTGGKTGAGKSTGWAGLAFWKAGAQGKRSAAAAAAAGTTKRTYKRKVAVRLTGDAGPEELRPLGTRDDVRLKRKVHVDTLLPEDVHYDASWLQCLSGSHGPGASRVTAQSVFKLILDHWTSGKRQGRQQPGGPGVAGHIQDGFAGVGDDDGGAGGVWDGGDGGGYGDENDGYEQGGDGGGVEFGGGGGGAWDDGGGGGGGVHPGDEDDEEQEQDAGVAQLLSQLTLDGIQPAPRKIAAPKIAFDQSAKQVDVKALKENIDVKLQGLAHIKHTPVAPAVPIAFQEVLHDLPVGGVGGVGEGGRGVSVHLAFICLLHLANEKGLYLGNRGKLDELNIKLPDHKGGVATA